LPNKSEPNIAAGNNTVVLEYSAKIPKKVVSMSVVVGPVLPRPGGYAFDTWTWEDGLSLGYVYHRIEDAHQAAINRAIVEGNVEGNIVENPESLDEVCICSTLDQFMVEIIERGVRLTDGDLTTLCSMPLV
jgi:hypothetical protein